MTLPFLLHPCLNQPITQLFGENPDWYPSTHGHNGIDYGGTPDTVIRAAYDGLVIVATDGGMEDYGIHVILQHETGVTIYGHLSALNVKVNQFVHAGDALGQMGNTGRSTGTHLHFEYRPGGMWSPAVDPMPLIVAKMPNQVVLLYATVLIPDLMRRSSPKPKPGNYPLMKQGERVPVFEIHPNGFLRIPNGWIKIGVEDEYYVEFEPVAMPVVAGVNMITEGNN